uniref:Uncharacterized protein n=1 Tax=Picea glauca TaxID=3330 RepID=A0A117NFX6_PICGL|nr:hypothetical protein ABT39_MTgene2231 [Picea glauca]QHR86662.1 hypothetical protein Q903MT_gene665 [Picea sitchensis]
MNGSLVVLFSEVHWKLCPKQNLQTKKESLKLLVRVFPSFHILVAFQQAFCLHEIGHLNCFTHQLQLF